MEEEWQNVGEKQSRRPQKVFSLIHSISALFDTSDYLSTFDFFVTCIFLFLCIHTICLLFSPVEELDFEMVVNVIPINVRPTEGCVWGG